MCQAFLYNKQFLFALPASVPHLPVLVYSEVQMCTDQLRQTSH
jgi:hypothetical protein